MLLSHAQPADDDAGLINALLRHHPILRTELSRAFAIGYSRRSSLTTSPSRVSDKYQPVIFTNILWLHLLATVKLYGRELAEIDAAYGFDCFVPLGPTLSRPLKE
jgi:hypothetical protein